MASHLSIYDLLKLLEVKSYFDLSAIEKRRVDEDLKQDIQAWSIVPHPKVLEEIYKAKNIIRYIIIIETIRANIYDSIREFLVQRTVNISSYFTGGSADFICDAYLSEASYNDFLSSLKAIILEKAKGLINDPRQLITVFKVDDTLVVSGKNLRKNYAPADDLFEQINNNPYEFELVLRNYRSSEATRHFGSEESVKKYLRNLKNKNIILGYRIVYDYCRGIDRQYVPLGNCTLQISNILESKEKKLKSDFVNPITELLAVTPTVYLDDADRVVSHISINEYKSPVDRHSWRMNLYGHDPGGAVNLFSYPLEGTLNESPIVLSDLPELMLKAKPYSKDELHLGILSHPLLATKKYNIGLPADSLLFQGLTLGDPGSGKSVTDVVLAMSVIDKVESLVVIDDSQTIEGKKGLIKDKYLNGNNFLTLKPSANSKAAKALFKSAVDQKGLRIIECMKPDYPVLLKAIMDAITEFPESTKDGNPRKIKYFLLLEEAQDGLKHTIIKEMFEEFTDCLTKASRKGWCIWVSTQRPSSLGNSELMQKKILGLLQNKLMHKISDSAEIDLLVSTLPTISVGDQAYVRTFVADPPEFAAVVLGTNCKDKNQCRNLGPVLVKIDMPTR